MMRHRGRWTLAAAVLLILLGAAASVAYADATPSVTFSGKNPAPPICKSWPDVRSLTIQSGTSVELINHTGAEATVYVGSTAGVTLGDGMAVSVVLPPGVQQVQLRPNCRVNGDRGTLVVTVLPLPAPTPSPTAAPPAQAGHGRRTPASGPGNRSGGGRGTLPIPGADPAIGRPGATGTSGSRSAGPLSIPSLVGAGPGSGPAYGQPYSVSSEYDSRGRNLLAVVALVCIVGVTVAIIRAIIAQRTDSVLRT